MSQAFIQELSPIVVQDMKRSKVLASLTLAQAILESNWGKSSLSRVGKNLFGIKGSTGSTYDTKEFINGNWVTIKAGFRHYATYAESIRDHSDMLVRMSRYKAVIGETNYRKACNAIHAAGYATDPTYAGKLIQLIEKYALYIFDETEGIPMAQALKWQEDMMKAGVDAGLFDTTHKALDTAPKWWIAAVAVRLDQRIKQLEGKGK